MSSTPWTSRRGVLALLVASAISVFLLLSLLSTSPLPHILEFRPTSPNYSLDTAWPYHAPPTTRPHSLTLRRSSSGRFTLNHGTPGPLLRGNTNDTLHLTLTNLSPFSTTLHFHGLATATVDGVPGLTTCALPPGGRKTYTLPLSRAGTFWYHAHISTTRVDGIYGALLIHDATEEPHQHTDSIVLLSEHHPTVSRTLLRTYLAPGNENAEPRPAPGVVLYPPHLPAAGRVRFVNVGAGTMVRVSAGGTDMELIEIDGNAVVGTTKALRVNVAQRYSVRVSSALQIEAIDCLQSVESGSAECSELPLPGVAGREPPPPSADRLVYLRVNFEIGDYRLSRGVVNGSRWKHGRLDGSLLVDLVEGGGIPGADRGLVVEIPSGSKVVDVVLDNFDDGNHPFHIHGHDFWVLGSGEGYFDYSRIKVGAPIKRDTVTVAAYQWTLIRVRMEKPGVWGLHCHSAWHQEAGMMMAFVVGLREIRGWDVDRVGCGAGQKWPGIDEKGWMQ